MKHSTHAQSFVYHVRFLLQLQSELEQYFREDRGYQVHRHDALGCQRCSPRLRGEEHCVEMEEIAVSLQQFSAPCPSLLIWWGSRNQPSALHVYSLNNLKCRVVHIHPNRFPQADSGKSDLTRLVTVRICWNSLTTDKITLTVLSPHNQTG